MNIAVLGVGRVGGAIARDLAAHGAFQVTAVDRSGDALEALHGSPGIRTLEVDLSDPDRVAALAAEHDLVVGAGPAALAFRSLEAVIDTATPIVDISFFPEDPFALDALARRRGAVAIVDAGISPGLSNLLLGAVENRSARVDRFICCVGGLPAERSGLFQYKAPFSPEDVIELYTRPARYREAGVTRTVPALSDLGEIEFAGVGTLEAFLTDGLRTVLRYEAIPNMREMTLRYPGHCRQMALLRDLGLFGRTPLEVEGVMVSPRAVTSRLLFPHWEFAPGEEDLTVFRVEIDAESDGVLRRQVFDLVDRYDRLTATSSMARTTGYVCTALVRLVASGRYAEPGISPPERVGTVPGCLEQVTRDLSARGVVLTESNAEIG